MTIPDLDLPMYWIDHVSTLLSTRLIDGLELPYDDSQDTIYVHEQIEIVSEEKAFEKAMIRKEPS